MDAASPAAMSVADFDQNGEGNLMCFLFFSSFEDVFLFPEVSAGGFRKAEFS